MQRIAYIVVPQFQVMVFAGMSAFELANGVVGTKHYDVHLLSEAGGAVHSSIGVPVMTEKVSRRVFDTLIVAAGLGKVETTPALLSFVRNSVRRTRRVASMCSGAFVLAEAGVLDGRRATTHWAYAQELQSRFPDIKLEPDRIFINDGHVWTSAGMTASIDMALTMIEHDLGVDVARMVARKLVVYHRRSGGQLQHSALLDIAPRSDRIQTALSYARNHLREPLNVEQLAGHAHLSPRQFSRAFNAETGQSPAKAVERLRVEAARLMLEQGQHPIEVVATETGFADRERMRRAFLRAFGHPPLAVRRAGRAARPA